MNKHVLLCLGGILTLLCTSCADHGPNLAAPIMAGQSREKEEILVGGNDELLLPEREIPRLKEEALRGSADAARKLALHFYAGLDRQDGMYWSAIGAENGDGVSAWNLALRLEESRDHLDRVRARFWFEKVRREGPAEFRELAVLHLKALDASK